MRQTLFETGQTVCVQAIQWETFITKYPDMTKRVLSDKQLKNNKKMKYANFYAREIMADEEQCKNAQVRLNVLRNRLYTSLIREYFANEKTEAEKL